jgi:hypothetical protein
LQKPDRLSVGLLSATVDPRHPSTPATAAFNFLIIMINSRAPFIPLPPADAVPGLAVTHEAITARARELWREHGCPENCDECIWLEAEAELLAIQENRFRHPILMLKGRDGAMVA